MAQVLTEKNIVVIGGTGTGKSSLFNNLALVLHFPTLEEAENGAKDFVPPIPVKVMFRNTLIMDGQDVNERSDQASSRTRKPQIYRIKCGNVVFNFIDTPGMADSEGTQLDDEHVKNITTCLYQFKEIHGILALLKSSDNTLNSSLKYTLNLVLSCLGKTAGKLISFGITHSYHNKDPGAAPNVITRYLNGLSENPNIKYSTENTYCIESMPLFYVLSTKKGVVSEEMDRLVYNLTYQNNVQELLRFFTNVFHGKESYNVLNVPTLIMAKQIQPALASLLPYLDSRDEEIKRDLERLEKETLTKDSEYAQQETKLTHVRQWREEYEVTKTRVVNKTQKVTKERIVQEQYMDTVVDLVEDGEYAVNPMGAAAAGATTGAVFGVIGSVIGGIVGGLFGKKSKQKTIHKVTRQVPKMRPKVEEYEAEETVPVAEEYKDTEYRDRVAVEENPEVKQILDKMEEERAKVKQMQSEKSTLYEKFQAEKKMLFDLLCDVVSYLEEHAIIAVNDTGLGFSENTATTLSSRIEKLKLSGHWNPNSRNIGPEELIARLSAMQDLDHFGNEIKNVLSECKNLEYVQYRVVDIQLELNNVFIGRVTNRI